MAAGYTTNFTIAYPECDIQNRIRLSNIMRQIQQIGGLHLDSIGYNYDRLANDGFVLLLAKEGITINRIPKAGEYIRLDTTPRKPKGANLLRDCTFYDEDGKELMFVETTWVAAETATHRIVRPKDLPYNFMESFEEKEYAVTSMRVKAPEHTEIVGRRRIVFSDIDCNRHLNNAVYGDIVYDFLPLELAENREIDKFFINFQHEAVLGEQLDIHYAELDHDTCYVSGEKDGISCFVSLIKFK